MAEEPQMVRGINWREVFPFTHLFRAFRIAIHPSKLVLALLTLLAIYLGGRILDGVWMTRHRAVPAVVTPVGAREPGEIEAYETRSATGFLQWRQDRREELAGRYARLLRELAPDKPNLKLREGDTAIHAAQRGDYTADAGYWVSRVWLPRELAAAEQTYKAARKDTPEALKAADESLAEARREAYRNAAGGLSIARAVRGQGIFDALLEYESLQINKIWAGVLSGNWLGGLRSVVGVGPAVLEAQPRDGVVVSVYKFFVTGPAWALQYHPLYFVLFAVLFLAVWSLFGGAIARIAAVHAADEGRKLSVRQGLGFAISKFLSFISAPLIPLIIIGGIGLLMAAVGGILLLIPYVGEIAIGLLFFLALAGGFVMTLVLLGTVGGFNLMYPTIAVEGSDSFDAISRSFSYVYAKPWRMLFYSAVALAYGALAYLFVRLFIWLMLVLSHYFVGLWAYRHAGNGDYLWPTMFPSPDWGSLPYDVNTLALNWGGAAGSYLIAIWVHLAITMLAAFAVSMYFSLNTIIYYLMRREVDATEMDDVYLEQPEEDFVETPSTAAAAPATVSTTSTSAAPASNEAAAVGTAEGAARTVVVSAPPPSERPPESSGNS